MNPQHAPYLALLPLFPLIGATINGLWGQKIQEKYGKKPIHWVATGALMLSALVALYSFVVLIGLEPENRALSWIGWDWIVIGFVDARFAFWVDPLTAMMLLIITIIGSLIHIYSQGYMHEEKPYWRFFAWLNLFICMMLILVLGDSFLTMFVGWEGVGLASFGLIGFYYKELDKAACGMKAFIVNRFGDACFVTGLFLLFWGMQGTWSPRTAPGTELADKPTASLSILSDYTSDAGARAEELALGAVAKASETGVNTPHAPAASITFQHLRKIFDDEGRRDAIVAKTVWGMPLMFLVCVLFFLGATAKSAQIPFYIWLPDAMAGPTPVSALMHAATMVTAGVYMIARLNFLYILSPGACTFVGFIGALTALFAASMGLFQYDIKKVLAYSTISQLGFMFIGVGVGAYWAGVFHLLTHACFKACLFLGSGSVIHGCHHEQDMRRMGGLKKYMPTTAKTYAWACLAIAGFPLFAGFCSKDEVLWKAMSTGAVLPGFNYAIWGMGLIAAGFTAFYMYRSYYMTFTGEYRGNETPIPELYPEDKARATDLFVPKAVPGPSDELIAELRAHHAGHSHDEHHDHDHDHHHDHHGGEPHESPWQMTMPLMVLGIASLVIGVIVGFPPFIGHVVYDITHIGFFHHPMLEVWLEPVLAPSNMMMKEHIANNEFSSWINGKDVKLKAEWILASISVVIAVSGFSLARWFYKDNANDIPARLLADTKDGLSAIPVIGGLLAPAADGVKFAHRLVYNKYYVDEAAYLVFVRGGQKFWNFCSAIDQFVIDGVVNLVGHVGRYIGYVQGAVDTHLVDGAVNGVGAAVMAGGQKIRKIQVGQIRVYLLGAIGGAVAAVMLLIFLS